jgi:hypothetical protein
MKIKIESEKIVKALKKLDGIEVILENSEDAKEAIQLIWRKSDQFDAIEFKELKDIQVTALTKYETSAVDYKMVFLLEFIFKENTSLDTKASVIKEVQGFFRKV